MNLRRPRRFLPKRFFTSMVILDEYLGAWLAVDEAHRHKRAATDAEMNALLSMRADLKTERWWLLLWGALALVLAVTTLLLVIGLLHHGYVLLRHHPTTAHKAR